MKLRKVLATSSFIISIVMTLYLVFKNKQDKELLQISLCPASSNISGSWCQMFDGLEGQILGYSAFYDDRLEDSPTVIIIASVLKRVKMSQGLYFSIYSGQLLRHTAAARMRRIDHYITKYTMYIVQCSIPDRSLLPEYISLHFSPTQGTTNGVILKEVLKIKRRLSGEIKDVGICYQPLNKNFSKLYTHYLSTNILRALGIETFIYYVKDDWINPKFRAVLARLAKKGEAVLVKWDLFVNPKDKLDQVAVWGQTAQIADCLYRFMYDVKYLFSIDIDEIPIPMSMNWKDTLKINMDVNSNKSALNLYNSYYLIGELSKKDLKEGTVFDKYREVYPPCISPGISKYVTRPRFIKIPCVHFVGEFLPGYEEDTLDEGQALMFHLKKDTVTKVPPFCLDRNGFRNNTRYTTDLLANIGNNVTKNFKQFCFEVLENDEFCYNSFKI